MIFSHFRIHNVLFSHFGYHKNLITKHDKKQHKHLQQITSQLQLSDVCYLVVSGIKQLLYLNIRNKSEKYQNNDDLKFKEQSK